MHMCLHISVRTRAGLGVHIRFCDNILSVQYTKEIYLRLLLSFHSQQTHTHQLHIHVMLYNKHHSVFGRYISRSDRLLQAKWRK